MVMPRAWAAFWMLCLSWGDTRTVRYTSERSEVRRGAAMRATVRRATTASQSPLRRVALLIGGLFPSLFPAFAFALALPLCQALAEVCNLSAEGCDGGPLLGYLVA